MVWRTPTWLHNLLYMTCLFGIVNYLHVHKGLYVVSAAVVCRTGKRVCF